MPTANQTQGVLDLTFLNLKDENDVDRILSEKVLAFQNQTTDSPSKTTKRNAQEIRAIRLSNNLIESLDVFVSTLPKSLDCSKVLWVDLSFNNVRIITEGFINLFPNITTIYLHANKISKLSELKKMSAFSSLKSLTLYGNPVEEKKHYHNYVLYTSPNVTHFDMSVVTKFEKTQMEVWAQTFRKKLNPDDD